MKFLFAKSFADVVFRWGLLSLLFAAGFKASPAWSKPDGTITGQVHHQGIVHYRGIAALWPNCQPSSFQNMETIPSPEHTVALAPDGSFFLTAPPGRYCLSVVLRQSKGENMGEPRPGDLIFFSPSMAGEIFAIDLHPGKVTNVGLNQDGWVLTEMK